MTIISTNVSEFSCPEEESQISQFCCRDTRGIPAALADLPVFYDDDPVHHPADRIVVCHDHHGRTVFSVDRLQKDQNASGCPGVQSAGRLITQKKHRILDQCSRDCDSLLLAAGELCRKLIADSGDSERFHQLSCLQRISR